MSVSVSTSSVVPSLSLDFINSKSLDPRIAFSRNSVATRTNQFGLLENVSANQPRLDYDPVTLAPRGLLIEESRTNLLSYSSQFDNAAWSKSNAIIVPNVVVAPDGSITASKIIESSGVTRGNISQSTVSVGQTLSVYAKAAEWTHIAIGSSNNAGLWAVATFNLSTGTIAGGASYGANTYSNALIVSVGNGWYRCSVQITAVTSTSAAVIMPFNQSGDPVNPVPTLNGNGTSGVYIWGAQLEVGAFPTSYIPSTETFTGRTSTATFIGSNGLIQTASSGVARYQYNPLNLAAAPFLLLEPTATNLITYSEQFDNAAWNKISLNTSGTPAWTNVAVAPDGTTTAEKIIPTITDSGYVQQSINTTTGVVYTMSCFVKAAEMTTVALGIGNAFGDTSMRVDLTTGQVTTLPTNSLGYFSTYIGNGWFRIGFTKASSGTGASGFYCFAIGTANSSNGIFIWGAQVETGNYATSYMPTTASTFARSTDTSTSTTTNRALETATITNMYPWFNAQEGTLFAETMIANSQYSNNYRYPGSASLDTNNANCIHIFYAINQSLSMRNISSEIFFGNDGSGAQFVNSSPITISDNSINKQTVMYKLNDANGSGNGVSGTTDTNIVVPQVNKLRIGDLRGGGSPLNGWVREVTYYSTRLTETQANSLTT